MAKIEFKPVNEQFVALRRGAAEIIREEELAARLEASRASGKPLRIYLGVDPTAPDLHLGHSVVLRKLKHFQDQGHTAIFLIGDFSAMIGDPSGQSDTRPPLTREQVDANVKTYLQQVYKILDRDKTEVRYNSEWLSPFSSQEIVQLCGKYRVARMLEREDFRSRLDANQPISMHELLYPLLTAIDAVKLKADVELGGTEQKFNLLVHREIQREYGLAAEAVLTMPLLVGLDGSRKMSKSLGNYVGIQEAPGEMFGKIMSISDELMWSYYELVTNFDSRTIERLKQEVKDGTLHPMDAKMQLAHTIIAEFHGEEAARKASEEFDRVYRKRQSPEEMKHYDFGPQGDVKLSRIIQQSDAAHSRTEAERLIKQGAVELDGVVIRDPTYSIDTTSPRTMVLRVGKRPPFLIRVT